MPPPGAPEFALTTAPVILPLSAPSNVWGVVTSASSRAEMVSTESAEFSRLTDVPSPVTTTSSSPSKSSSSTTSTTVCPSGTVTVSVRNPTNENWSRRWPGGSSISYAPSASVRTPIVEAGTETAAPGTGPPSFALVTVPRTVWAEARAGSTRRAATRACRIGKASMEIPWSWCEPRANLRQSPTPMSTFLLPQVRPVETGGWTTPQECPAVSALYSRAVLRLGRPAGRRSQGVPSGWTTRRRPPPVCGSGRRARGL